MKRTAPPSEPSLLLKQTPRHQSTLQNREKLACMRAHIYTYVPEEKRAQAPSQLSPVKHWEPRLLIMQSASDYTKIVINEPWAECCPISAVCFHWMVQKASQPSKIRRLCCNDLPLSQNTSIWSALAQHYSSGIHGFHCIGDHPSVFSFSKWLLESWSTGLAHHERKEERGQRSELLAA